MAASTASASGIETTGLVAMIHKRLDAPVGDGAEHVDRLQARLCGNRRRPPEALDAVAILGTFDCHVGGKHVGKPADLAPAHGIRLAGEARRAPCPAGRCGRWRGGS